MALQNSSNGKLIFSVTDRIAGRVTAGGGLSEEITCTAAGRSVIGAADIAAIKTLLGVNIIPAAIGTVGQTLRVNSGATALEYYTPAASLVRLPFTAVTATTQVAVADNAYSANNAARVVFTLPATCPAGAELEFVAQGVGGFGIAQLAGQSIRFGTAVTTAGVAGKIESTSQYDSVRIKCLVADTTYHVACAVGNLDVV